MSSVFGDLHTHTRFSDGDNTPEEMVLAAIDMGMPEIGFTDHSFTFFDTSYCVAERDIDEYLRTIDRLKEKYEGKIRIFAGIEQDYYSKYPTDRFDYVIGSVHYVKVGDEYFPVDESKEIQKRIVNDCFGGDYYLFAEAYFENVADVVNRTHADVVGHFDVIKKYNRDGDLFDETNPRYTNAARQALDGLLQTGAVFEINTGLMARGYRTDACPSPGWIEYILANGGRTKLSSDSHSTSTLCYGFEKYRMLETDGSFVGSRTDSRGS